MNARLSIPLIACMLSAAPASAALTHHWAFEDPEPFRDLAGTADATAGSNVTLVDSERPDAGQAMAVGASSTVPANVLTIPQADAPGFGTGDFSLVLWVRRLDEADAVNADGVLDALNGTTVGYQLLFLDAGNAGNDHKLRLRLDDSAAHDGLFDTAFRFTDQAWHHVAITVDRDAADGVRFYIDGVLDATHNPTALTGSIDPSQDLWIGGINSGATNGMDGLLADLRIYDTALSAGEVAALYQPVGLPPSDILTDATTLSPTPVPGQTVALLSAVDPGDTHTFTLVSGTGDTDNAVFTLTANRLRLSGTPPTGALRVRVRATDSTGLGTEKSLTFSRESPATGISEFLAANSGGLTDSDGDRSDWIELTNPGTAWDSLAGWALSDDPAGVLRWTLPAVELPPGGTLLVFASGKDRTPLTGELHAAFRLSAAGETLTLFRPDGSSASAFAPFPAQADNIAWGTGSGGGTGFLLPTPGAPNGPVLTSLPPVITSVTENPPPPAPGDSLTVSAAIALRQGTMDHVTLTWRAGYSAEQTLTMSESPAGTWTATIPGLFPAGEMIRWSVTAANTTGDSARAPLFTDPLASPQYFGTVAGGDEGLSTLPVLHWFTEDTARADSGTGTRASLCYQGRFYDNIYVRTRGQTSASWPKHKYKFDFSPGDFFRPGDGLPSVEEFNLNSHYREVFSQSSNTSYLREPLMYEWLRTAGCPAPAAFPLHVRRNGAHFGLFSYIEQIDARFLKRYGFTAGGPLYKAVNVPATMAPNPTASNYRKVLRETEPYTDLAALAAGINPGNPERLTYLLDHVNVPGLINLMAAMATVQNHDQLTRNYYLYLDPARNEWFRLPWDVDQSFPIGVYINTDQFRSPLYGDAAHPQGTGSINPLYQNYLLGVVLDNPLTRELYMRRLRTFMDRYLDVSTGYFEGLVNDGLARLSAEAALDRAAWAAKGVTLSDITAGTAEILNVSLPARRNSLFTLYGPTGSALIPGPAMAPLAISFGTVETNPASGNQDEEYLELVNSSSEAIDLSGWQIQGGVDFVFPPGAVIPAASPTDPERGKLFVSASVAAFRARATSPSAGESRLVLGNFSGHLSNFSEILTLSDESGTVRASITTPDTPSPAQRWLRITEIHYHPADPDGASEFVELTNLSPDITLDLTGVHFSAGVDFLFTGAAVTTLAPGARVLVVRSAAAFRAVYGTGPDGLIAGEFANATSLDNNGELLKLDDSTGSTIHEVTWNDSGKWPAAADGTGPSLVLIADGQGAPGPGNAAAWRPSAAGPTPGTGDALAFTGDPSGDADANGIPDLLDYLFAGEAAAPGLTLTPRPDGTAEITLRHRTAADAVLVQPEISSTLTEWRTDGLIFAGRDVSSPGWTLTRWRTAAPVDGPRLHARCRVSRRE